MNKRANFPRKQSPIHSLRPGKDGGGELGGRVRGDGEVECGPASYERIRLMCKS